MSTHKSIAKQYFWRAMASASLLALMATSLPGTALAANFTWIGGNSSDLDNGSNWGAASTYSFTADDDLYVNWTTAPPQYQPVLSGGKQVSISGITLGGTSAGACAGCNGSLLVTGAGTKLTTTNLTVRTGAGNGTVLLNVADQATVNTNLFIAGKALINLTSGAKLTVTPGNLFSVNDGSVFNINTGATVQGGEFSLTGGSRINLDGTGSSFKSTGYITVNGDAARTSMINLSNGAALSGVFIILGSSQKAALNIGAAEGSAATTAGTVVTSQSVQLGKYGVLAFNHTSPNYVFGSAIGNVSATSVGEIHQVAGTTIMTGYSGGFTGTIIITGGTLQFGNGAAGGAMAAKSIVTGTDASHHGTLVANRAADFVYNGVISGNGNVEQMGTGTATLAGINTFTGGLTLTRGTVAVSSDSNLGDASGALHFNGGKLQVTADMSSAREITLSASSNTISVDNGKTLVLSGQLENDQLAAGQLIKSGNGTLILAAQNSYSGPTTISGGILQLGDGTSDGMIQGSIIDNANLVIANKNDTSLSNTISGGGVLTQNGPAILTLSGNNSYSGGTHFKGGIVSVAQDANLGLTAGALSFDGGTLQITGTAYQSTNRTVDISSNGGRLNVVDAGNSFQLTSALNGSGPFAKDGAGTLVLASDSSGYTGLLSVDAGQLRLDGASLGGAIDVKAGASLAGQGSIAGHTTVANGGVLMGRSGQQLSFGGGLSLAANSETSVELNGGSSQNALFDVQGDLALNGQLTLAQGSIATIGVYRIFDYSGSLSGTMSIADAAGGDVSNFSLQTSIDHQVNLINNGGRTIAFWNGTGQIQGSVEGGDGSWNATATNWSDQSGSQNSEWFDDTFAVFGGTAGHVTIASGYVPNIDGAQFTTDGYLLDGSKLTLSTGGDHTIIVGDGSLQSASMTATIASVIEGSEGLIKSGAGQLVLTGENSYTGTTTVTEGLLTLGEGGSINASGNIILAESSAGHGSFAIDKNADFTLSNAVTGTGDVFKRGSGTTTFAADNSFSGGLNVEAGTAKAGVVDHAFGSGRVKIAGGATLDLADLNETIGGLDGNQSGDGNITLGSGTLTLNQDLHGGYSGVISGSGGLVKNGSGDLVLYGANDYSGQSTINAGSLVQAAQGGFSSASTYSVASGATVELGGFATSMAGLNNAGSVAFGGQGGTVLSVSGDYVGNGGTLLMSTVLGDDSAQTDQLVVTGNTAGDTKLSISNRGGLGAQTVNGIKIIDVGGQSDGRFTLNGDYTTKDGQQAIMTAS
ncbi:autotransporter-associated beta strand repeat-containing protein, partial [Ochrobactrum sp. Sa2BUA5]|nr:autotransporter-associated beta strand repeat-containing protein [Ochrobactrum gallinarum]